MSDQPAWVEFITLERVFELHADGIREWGGLGSLTPNSRPCVEGSIGNAWAGALYQEPEEATRGLSFVAFLLVYLAKNHCFVDGNKRVAWSAAMDILAARNLTVGATTEEAEDLMNCIIQEDRGADFVADWIASRLDWIH